MTDMEKFRSLGILPNKNRGDEFYLSQRDLQNALENSPYRNEIVNYVVSNGGNIKNDLLKWPKSRGGIMPDIGILRHMLAGNIVIDPFNIDNLQSNGYEVSISNIFFKRKTKEKFIEDGNGFPVFYGKGDVVYDPYSPESIQVMWAGPMTPQVAGDLQESIHMGLKGGAINSTDFRNVNTFQYIKPEDQIIMFGPSEMILARTAEKIGGKNILSTFVAGKSTPARHGFEICSDSFLGDVGFTYYWALEIVNKHPDAAVYLVAGTKVATMIFMEHNEPPLVSYKEGTFYQGQGDDNGSIRKIVPKALKKS